MNNWNAAIRILNFWVPILAIAAADVMSVGTPSARSPKFPRNQFKPSRAQRSLRRDLFPLVSRVGPEIFI
jgi:hypothetical protein